MNGFLTILKPNASRYKFASIPPWNLEASSSTLLAYRFAIDEIYFGGYRKLLWNRKYISDCLLFGIPFLSTSSIALRICCFVILFGIMTGQLLLKKIL